MNQMSDEKQESFLSRLTKEAESIRSAKERLARLSPDSRLRADLALSHKLARRDRAELERAQARIADTTQRLDDALRGDSNN